MNDDADDNNQVRQEVGKVSLKSNGNLTKSNTDEAFNAE
jgi:hypothetical protein